jgi:hypothetical protein
MEIETMQKITSTLPATAKSLPSHPSPGTFVPSGALGSVKALALAARAVARMEAAAQAVHAEANGDRGFQAVSSKEGFSAVIRHGKTLIEISGDDFAVRQTD